MFHFFQRRGSFIAKTLVFRVSGQDKGKSWFILRPSCNLIALKPTESSQGSFATRPWIVILILAKSIDTMTNSTKFRPSLIPSRYSRFEISSFVYSFSKRTFISNLSPHFSCHSRFETYDLLWNEFWKSSLVKGAKFALIFLDCVPNPRPRNRSQFANNLHESPGNSTAEWLDRSIMKHGAGKGGEEKKGASCQFHA